MVVSTQNNIGIIIQCRDGSARYYRKSVRPFYKGKSILEIILDKLKHLPYTVVVATCAKSHKTINICRKTKTEWYMGDEEDVLGRIYECAKHYNFEAIFRICADNPFLSLPLMYPVEVWGQVKDYDYVAFDNCMRRHEGFFLEFVSMYALETATKDAIFKPDREHVTPYIVRHPDRFKQRILAIPERLNETYIRLSVDTESDFKTAQEVYKKVGERHWNYIMEYIENNDLMQANMLREIALNPKRVQ